MLSHYVVKTAKARSTQPRPPAMVWPAGTVWAAAAYAHRINGEYIKYPQAPEDGEARVDNRTLMYNALQNNTLLTEQDIALGQQARDYHSGILLFRALQKPLTEFETVLSRTCALSEIAEHDRYSLAIICSQIDGYQRCLEQDRVRGLVDRSAPPVGAVGTKITAAITVVRSNFSVKYGVYFVNAVTDLGQPIFFSYRENLVTGSQHQITGTVKVIKSDATQLNRVKTIKENQ